MRISGNSIQNGKPVAIDDDYYVNLTEVTGHYMWKCFYIGGKKFDIALAYAADTDNNTITFEVETTDSQLPALYTIGKDGVAKRGMEVDTESIKGVSLLKQK